MLKQYKEYLQDNPKGYWFKSKLYGWGWTPVTREGWLAVIVYVVLVMIFTMGLTDTTTLLDASLYSIVPIILLTLAMLWICYKKGEKPRWQWGIKNNDK